MSGFDLFISYAHGDGDSVRELVRSLTGEGLRVWFDESEIDDFASITNSIVNGLLQSKAFLAWYSEKYPTRRACQWELTAAVIAAQGSPEDITRVLLLNPETSDYHIQPRNLLNQHFVRLTDSEQISSAAASIAKHLARLTERAPRAITPPQWHPLPHIGSSFFVGRIDSMWQIYSRLHDMEAPLAANRTPVGIAIVTGLGGSGKSLLVEEYALRFAAAYPAGVYWLEAGGYETEAELSSAIDAQFTAIATSIGLDIAGKNAGEIKPVLREYFERTAKPGLWIVDGFPAGLGPDSLRSWLAPHFILRTVVTTRANDYARISDPIEIGRLPDFDAHILLTSRVAPSNDDEHEAMKGIAAELGNHALALDVTAGALSTYSEPSPFRIFLEELGIEDQDTLELAAELTGTLPNGHERSIASTLLRTIRKVNDAALDFLRLASLLANVQIAEPIAMVTLGMVTPGLADRLNLQEITHRWRLAVRDLRSFALAEKLGESVSGGAAGWSVHALVARTVRFAYRGDSRLEEVRQAALELFNRWLNDLDKAGAPAGIALAHARKLARSGHGISETNLLQFVTKQDELSGAYGAAVEGWRALLTRIERLYGPDHKLTLTLRNNIAVALRKLGDVNQARDIHQDVLAARRHVLGEQDTDTISSMDNLGVCMTELGNFAKAAEMHREAMQRFAEVTGPESQQTVTSMVNLGGALRELGILDEALSLLDRALRLRWRDLGREHPRTVHVMVSLGDTLRQMGQSQQSKQLLEDAVSVLSRTLGDDNPLTLEAKHNLAAALSGCGDASAAEALGTEVWNMRRKLLGEQHPDTLLSNELVATARSKNSGDLTLTRDLQRSIVDEYLRTLGPNHSDTARAQSNLGVTLLALGENAEAVKVLEAALRSASHMGKRHPISTSAAWNLYIGYSNENQNDAHNLVSEYLAWLMSANPADLAETQRDVARKFAQTSEGMFESTKARLVSMMSRHRP